MAAAMRVQQSYDHRLKLKVFQGEHEPTTTADTAIPKSTLATWKRKPPKPVVSLLKDEQPASEIELEKMRTEIQRLKARLAATRSIAMLLLTALRLSGFTLDGARLPDGDDKKRLLRTIQRASQHFKLSSLLNRFGLSPSRYHAWAVTKPCELSDVSSCPRTHPTQVTSDEQATIGKLLQDPEYSHVPTGTLVKLAQRLKLVYASSTTWYRLIRHHQWRRPRKRTHPNKPTVGVRATRPNEIWHVDISVVKLLDGTRVYLQAVMDNFSRKILVYRVSDKYEPTATAMLLEEAASCLPPSTDSSTPTPNISIYCDGGVENFNDAVDQTLSRFQMQRIHAQIDVDFSNSLIEAFWRSAKHNCLFQQRLDSTAALRKCVDFYIQQHNEVMPHSAFRGQTPNEGFFGTGKNIEAELKQARAAARRLRVETNRKRSCGACPKTEPDLRKIQLDKP
jgi:transposase InsO family protein